jgi:hypothetical protein
MALKELVPGELWEYENFITDSELGLLLDKARFAREEDWFAEDLPDYDKHHAGKTFEFQDTPGGSYLSKAIDLRVAALFKDVAYMNEIGSICRATSHLEPVGMHRDNADQDIVGEHRNTHVKYGVLMYLNDDYIGGEICYPELGIEYKPKPGVLLIHHAGNLHGVNPVTEGVRFSMTSFVYGLDALIV